MKDNNNCFRYQAKERERDQLVSVVHTEVDLEKYIFFSSKQSFSFFVRGEYDDVDDDDMCSQFLFVRFSPTSTVSFVNKGGGWPPQSRPI